MTSKNAQDLKLSTGEFSGGCRRGPGWRGWGAAALSGAALVLLVSLLSPLGEPGSVPVGTRSPVMESPLSVESVVMEGDRATVKIKNHSPFLVIVHSGGVRVGWMRPQRVGIIRGLTTGYHKFFAHSQYGTVSWGPKEVWVPGPWNLAY